MGHVGSWEPSLHPSTATGRELLLCIALSRVMGPDQPLASTGDPDVTSSELWASSRVDRFVTKVTLSRDPPSAYAPAVISFFPLSSLPRFPSRHCFPCGSALLAVISVPYPQHGTGMCPCRSLTDQRPGKKKKMASRVEIPLLITEPNSSPLLSILLFTTAALSAISITIHPIPHTPFHIHPASHPSRCKG